MKVYTDDTDTVVAESVEDAIAFLVDELDYDASYVDEEWYEIPDNREIGISWEPDDWDDQVAGKDYPENALIRERCGGPGVTVVAPAKDWAAINGRGMLCSTEY